MINSQCLFGWLCRLLRVLIRFCTRRHDWWWWMCCWWLIRKLKRRRPPFLMHGCRRYHRTLQYLLIAIATVYDRPTAEIERLSSSIWLSDPGSCSWRWKLPRGLLCCSKEEPPPAESHTSKIMERSILTSHYHWYEVSCHGHCGGWSDWEWSFSRILIKEARDESSSLLLGSRRWENQESILLGLFLARVLHKHSYERLSGG